MATFYHELNEARTDADVEDAIRAENSPNADSFLGWTSRQGQECGDFPVFESNNDLTKVFQEVALSAGGGTVPVQLQYSNNVQGPEGRERLQRQRPNNEVICPAFRQSDCYCSSATKSLDFLLYAQCKSTTSLGCSLLECKRRQHARRKIATSLSRLHPVIGPQWVAVDDAAASLDPLSSLGIGHALKSGIRAARIVDTRFAGDEELAVAYPNDVARFAEEFYARRAAIYRSEQRWPQSEFWRSRQALL